MRTRFVVIPRLRLAAAALVAALAFCGAATAQTAGSKRQNADERRAAYPARDEVRAFMAEMRDEHGFAAADLDRWLAAARFQPRIVELMNRPVMEPPKWHEYARPFLAPERIEAGLAFWSSHAQALARAQADTGVPAELIVAILGVETAYGRVTGSHRVIDALATLAFDYPRRSTFFRGELREFLLLAREQGFSPLAPRGSFAGAMGLPQFMPGSYRRYAVDFDGSGVVDLWRSADDAIGSVANYFVAHDWKPGQPVMMRATIDPPDRDGVLRRLDGGLSERRPLAAWNREGVATSPLPVDVEPDPVAVLMLEESADAASYWLAFHNFYVITRYNRSRLYASAVWHLAQALRSAR
ncbi:MAG: lytic murein transglycosylase B [Burkholderiales bacterium]|nr:lytic murein transglycosylase B [Burkholderiales bacterium]GIK87867.1 MAG: murein transglycosylase [Betaproteobacteria bacterium]